MKKKNEKKKMKKKVRSQWLYIYTHPAAKPETFF